MDQWIAELPDLDWLIRRLWKIAGSRPQAQRALGISAPRLSNLLARFNGGVHLGEERARAIADSLADVLPEPDRQLLARLLGRPPASPGDRLALGGEREELLERLQERCRALPFLEPSFAQAAPHVAALYLDPKGLALHAWSLLAWAEDPSLELAAASLHLAHLAERAGAWVTMWVALQVAQGALQRLRPRGEERISFLDEILRWLNAAAVLAYNMGDDRRARALHERALGIVGVLRFWDRRLPLPQDFCWAWEARIRCNQAFSMDSIREAEDWVRGLPGDPPPAAWHPDPGALADCLTIYKHAALVTVALRIGAQPRDLRGWIMVLVRAFEEVQLPAALRAAAGRKAAWGLRVLGEGDGALALASRALALAEQFGLASQARKTRHLFPELGGENPPRISSLPSAFPRER